jgi:hypothetical protein
MESGNSCPLSKGETGGENMTDYSHKFLVIVLCIISMATITALYGCASTVRAPKNFNERIEAALLAAGKTSDTIISLTCQEFDRGGRCLVPGKPLMPEQAMPMHERLEKAVDVFHGLKEAGGITECLGAPRTVEACLATATGILTQIDQMLIDARSKQ